MATLIQLSTIGKTNLVDNFADEQKQKSDGMLCATLLSLVASLDVALIFKGRHTRLLATSKIGAAKPEPADV